MNGWHFRNVRVGQLGWHALMESFGWGTASHAPRFQRSCKGAVCGARFSVVQFRRMRDASSTGNSRWQLYNCDLIRKRLFIGLQTNYRHDSNTVLTAVGWIYIFPRSSNTMRQDRKLSDVGVTKKSNKAAFNCEWAQKQHISQRVYMIATEFQRLYPCFQGPALWLDWCEHRTKRQNKWFSKDGDL